MIVGLYQNRCDGHENNGDECQMYPLREFKGFAKIKESRVCERHNSCSRCDAFPDEAE